MILNIQDKLFGHDEPHKKEHIRIYVWNDKLLKIFKSTMKYAVLKSPYLQF